LHDRHTCRQLSSPSSKVLVCTERRDEEVAVAFEEAVSEEWRVKVINSRKLRYEFAHDQIEIFVLRRRATKNG
jgi:hypothetical protein